MACHMCITNFEREEMLFVSSLESQSQFDNNGSGKDQVMAWLCRPLHEPLIN